MSETSWQDVHDRLRAIEDLLRGAFHDLNTARGPRAAEQLNGAINAVSKLRDDTFETGCAERYRALSTDREGDPA